MNMDAKFFKICEAIKSNNIGKDQYTVTKWGNHLQQKLSRNMQQKATSSPGKGHLQKTHSQQGTGERERAIPQDPVHGRAPIVHSPSPVRHPLGAPASAGRPEKEVKGNRSGENGCSVFIIGGVPLCAENHKGSLRIPVGIKQGW